jgi:hypothetical protein
VTQPKFQADENLSEKVVSGIVRRQRAIDFRGSVALRGLPDAKVLAMAAGEGRILVTRDAGSLADEFERFVETQASPGVIAVAPQMDNGHIIEQLLKVWAESDAEHWRNKIAYLIE